MEIIYKITNSVKTNTSSFSGNDLFIAADVAIQFMNSILTDDDIQQLLRFSEKLEQQNYPNFKSKYSKEVNCAIWNTICWIVRSKMLCEDLQDLLSTYTNYNNFHFCTEYSCSGTWSLEFYNTYNELIFSKHLNNYYGIMLITEISMAINEMIMLQR